MAVEVLDRGHVPPGDLIDGDSEHGRNLPALGGAWRPASECDRCDAAVLEAAAFGELGHVNRLLTAQVGNGVGHLFN